MSVLPDGGPESTPTNSGKISNASADALDQYKAQQEKKISDAISEGILPDNKVLEDTKPEESGDFKMTVVSFRNPKTKKLYYKGVGTGLDISGCEFRITRTGDDPVTVSNELDEAFQLHQNKLLHVQAEKLKVDMIPDEAEALDNVTKLVDKLKKGPVDHQEILQLMTQMDNIHKEVSDLQTKLARALPGGTVKLSKLHVDGEDFLIRHPTKKNMFLHFQKRVIQGCYFEDPRSILKYNIPIYTPADETVTALKLSHRTLNCTKNGFFINADPSDYDDLARLVPQ